MVTLVEKLAQGSDAPIPRTLRRKLRGEVGWNSEQGLPQMGPTHYLSWLHDLHGALKPRWYFEIGTESGASLSFAECASIAVDPHFQLQSDISRNKPELHQFQGFSDDFFASNMLGRLGVKIDLAFLDGMHLYEYLLRDFIGTERHMARDGVVLMHDCVPVTRAMAERDWDKTKTVAWTGDVWKVVAILRDYRPDLDVTVLDLAPTGIVQICNCDPNNTVLTDHYDEIVAKWKDVTLDSLGLDRFCEIIDLQPATQPTARVTTARSISVKTCMSEKGRPTPTGDWAFGVSLANALERRGHASRVDDIDAWATAPADDLADVVVQGHDHHPPRPGVAPYLWLIYPGKRFDLQRLVDYRHVFVASQIHARKLMTQVPGAQISYLPQAFDAGIMAPPAADAARDSIVFVGTNHFGKARPVVEVAQQSGLGLRLWGAGWADTPYAPSVVADGIANAQLGDLYRSAEIVLCDHTSVMARNGYVSNRVFDALACGAPVIMDRVAGLPDEFTPFVKVVDSLESYHEAVRQIRAETAEDRRRRIAFAQDMIARHSFDARAETILNRMTADHVL